jgi:hypothetical protein
MICEDTLVSCWFDREDQFGIYTGSTSAHSAISHDGPATRMFLPDIERTDLLFSSPTSGRFVVLDSSNSVTVLDIF